MCQISCLYHKRTIRPYFVTYRLRCIKCRCLRSDLCLRPAPQEDEAAKYTAISMNNDDWLLMLEQALLVVVIFGRWLLPKGDLTRDQLSSLLLVYLGTASDITDFFSALNEKTILPYPSLIIIVLVTWAWSIMQVRGGWGSWSIFWTVDVMFKNIWGGFSYEGIARLTQCALLCTFNLNLHCAAEQVSCCTFSAVVAILIHIKRFSNTTLNITNGVPVCQQFGFVVTAKHDGHDDDEEEATPGNQRNSVKKRFAHLIETEAWGICVSLMMLDGPYAVIRFIMIFSYNISTYSNYFFLAKNVTVIMLQGYRIRALHLEYLEAKERRKQFTKVPIRYVEVEEDGEKKLQPLAVSYF